MLRTSSADAATDTALDLITALQNSSPASPFDVSNSNLCALHKLAEIFKTATPRKFLTSPVSPSNSLLPLTHFIPLRRNKPTPLLFSTPTTTVPPIIPLPPILTTPSLATLSPMVGPTLIPNSQPTETPPYPRDSVPPPRVGPTFIPISQPDNLTTNNTTIRTPDIHIVAPVLRTQNLEPIIVRIKDPRPNPILRKSKRNPFRPARYTHNTSSRYSQAANFLSFVQPLYQCNAVIDSTTEYSLEYRHLVKGDDKLRWTTGFANELGRLAQGVGTRMPTGTNTIRFIARNDVPKNRTVTYGRIVATIRPTKAENHRVRLTVGDDRIEHVGDKSTPIALSPPPMLLFYIKNQGLLPQYSSLHLRVYALANQHHP